MHLHWKYRQLVKIFVERKSFPQVKDIAISVEAESGGVLVSVDKTTKGYAIIVYSGKNYQRPNAFRPKSLLTRRQALARSIELQRRSIMFQSCEKKFEKLKSELEDMKAVEEIDKETLYSRVDNASDDDEELEEDEVEESYLETYESCSEHGTSWRGVWKEQLDSIHQRL
ncbi:hypothetical protein ACH5RR_004062 [Cinchona calisaya]|uniref:CRM domain-containing protein n=1 Tax=Cinchona calisaya TaxID=153742 RepID=A0ABD3AWM3_9GENT